MKLIIGISGQTFDDHGNTGTAGSGKDTVADFLVEKHRGVKVALADPLKRICREVFDFTDEQLWGPSSERNKPDPRWVQLKKGALGERVDAWNHASEQLTMVPSPEEDIYLTPRYALQQLGTEWGRSCSADVWVRYALKTARHILDEGLGYDAKFGLIDEEVTPYNVVAISDVRFENELDAIKAAGGKVIRVRRKTETLGGAAGAHVSERGLSDGGDDDFDHVIDNNSTLENLALHVDRMMAMFSGRILPYSEEEKDIPPFMRGR